MPLSLSISAMRRSFSSLTPSTSSERALICARASCSSDVTFASFSLVEVSVDVKRSISLLSVLVCASFVAFVVFDCSSCAWADSNRVVAAASRLSNFSTVDELARTCTPISSIIVCMRAISIDFSLNANSSLEICIFAASSELFSSTSRATRALANSAAT